MQNTAEIGRGCRTRKLRWASFISEKTEFVNSSRTYACLANFRSVNSKRSDASRYTRENNKMPLGNVTMRYRLVLYQFRIGSS